MKKYLLIFFCFFSFYQSSFSQVIKIAKISPQHLLVNTFSVTVERASGPMAKSSIVISPFVTYFERKDLGNLKDKLAGAGLELGQKIYVLKPDSANPLTGFYAIASLSYGYYTAHYQRIDDSTFINNNYGNSYYAHTSSGRFYDETIHKLGADVAFGYQVSISNVFYIDSFFGAGMRYAISSAGESTNYDDMGILGVGHSGIVPKAGVKFGLKF
jgi:hypothetical protein